MIQLCGVLILLISTLPGVPSECFSDTDCINLNKHNLRKWLATSVSPSLFLNGPPKKSFSRYSKKGSGRALFETSTFFYDPFPNLLCCLSLLYHIFENILCPSVLIEPNRWIFVESKSLRNTFFKKIPRYSSTKILC